MFQFRIYKDGKFHIVHYHLLNVHYNWHERLVLFTNSVTTAIEEKGIQVENLATVQKTRKCNCLELSSFLANKRVHVTKYFGNLCTYENPLNHKKKIVGR